MKKNITLNESKRRFQQLLEYTYYGNGDTLIGEAGDETQEQGSEQNAPQDGTMDGGMQSDATGQEMPTVDDAQGQTPQGFNPQEQSVQGDISQDDFATEEPAPDDDVIDVSDLTDAQKETEEKVEKYGEEFNKVFRLLGQWEELIKSNNEKIEDLKAEFEKRNPTQVEKLSMQTAKSGPFSVNPEEYWNEKEKTSNYSTENDNNGVGQEQYTITKDDIEKPGDWKSISDSMSDVMYRPTLKNTMDF